MRCGFYGKLPAKRDFVATAAPREFLAVWEPWLQAGVSASRMQLGPAWQEAFLRAPIWRFWLGAEVAGAATLGAMMPSVDGVGRYFPLTVYARSDPGESIPPPDLEPNEAWLAGAEELLLSALAEGAVFEAMSAELERLGGPKGHDGAALPASALHLRGGALAAEGAPVALPETLAAFRRADHARSCGSASYWWTVGGEEFLPRILAAHRLPDPHLFAGMLTGRFEDMPS